MYKKRRFWIYVFAAFLGALTLNLGHPVTPKYVRELNIGSEWFGYFFAFMSLGHLIMSPINGNLADKYGRKPVFIIGLLGYAFAQFLFIQFDSGIELLGPRIMAGIFGNAVIMSSIGFFTDISSKKERTTALSIYAGLAAFGAATAYLIGGRLGVDSVLGTIGTFKFQIGFALSLALLAFIFIRNYSVEHSTQRKSIIQNFKNIRELKDKDIYIMLFVAIFVSIAFVSISKFLDVYIKDIGYDSDVLGNFVFVTGLVGIFSSFVILPLLNKKFDALLLLKVSLLLGGVMVLATFAQSNLRIALYSTFLVYMLFKAFYEPLDQAILSRKFDGNQGTVLGIRKSFFAIGSVIGPLLAGFIYKYQQEKLFFVAAFILLFSSLILILFVRKKKSLCEINKKLV